MDRFKIGTLLLVLSMLSFNALANSANKLNVTGEIYTQVINPVNFQILSNRKAFTVRDGFKFSDITVNVMTNTAIHPSPFLRINNATPRSLAQLAILINGVPNSISPNHFTIPFARYRTR